MNLHLCAVSELTWSSLFQSMFGRVILSEKYKATYSNGPKTNVSKSRIKKEDKRKARKRSSLAVENRKSRASVIFLSLAGTAVDGDCEPEKYRVPQFNNVDLDVLEQRNRELTLKCKL